MTKDNEDALRLANQIDQFKDKRMNDAAAHLRRLVRENEAKAALLRQAVEALEHARTFVGAWPAGAATMVAIRQHLEGKA